MKKSGYIAILLILGFWLSNGVLVERINFGIALTLNGIPGTKVDLKEFKDAKAAALYLGSPEFQKK